jgi:hypothetical protein
MTAVSRSGDWRAELLSANTDTTAGTVDGAAIGTSNWMVEISPAADAGAADGGAGDLQVKAEKPYMPIHMHGASVPPDVTAAGDGTYTVSDIDFIMAGYWQVTLDLQSGGAAAADPVVFSICIPP